MIRSWTWLLTNHLVISWDNTWPTVAHQRAGRTSISWLRRESAWTLLQMAAVPCRGPWQETPLGRSEDSRAEGRGCNKKRVWALSPVPGTELLKTLEFPKWYECLSFFRRSPFLSHPSLCQWDDLGWGPCASGWAGLQKDRVIPVRAFSPTYWSSKRRGGLGIELYQKKFFYWVIIDIKTLC